MVKIFEIAGHLQPDPSYTRVLERNLRKLAWVVVSSGLNARLSGIVRKGQPGSDMKMSKVYPVSWCKGTVAAALILITLSRPESAWPLLLPLDCHRPNALIQTLGGPPRTVAVTSLWSSDP